MLFKYKAIKNGKVYTDKIQADSQELALGFLKTNDYFPISIRRIDIPLTDVIATFFSRITFNDIVNLTRQLAIMLDAGLTLIDAIDILKHQTSKPALLKIIERFDKEIKAGRNFSSALLLYPQYFSNLYISLVKSGEASGKLSEVLLRLSDNLEKERIFKSKLRGALIYPSFIIVAMFIVAFIMITFVVPKLLELYKDFDAQLPLTTKILLFISTILSKYWLFIIIGLFGIVLILLNYFKTAAGKLQLDTFLLKLPVFGNVLKMAALVDTTRALSILISSGVPLMESLSITIESSSNLVFRNAFINLKKYVEKGTSLGNAMKQTDMFPPILVQMTLVGEQTGHLDDTLFRVSRYFEIDSEVAIKAMTTLIEPMILVVLGIGVGFLVFAIITPIYTLTTSFK